MIPLYRRIFDDQLTILAYRCLVKEDEREAPSFLLESVVGARRPAASRSWARGRTWVVAKEGKVTVLDHLRGTREKRTSPTPSPWRADRALDPVQTVARCFARAGSSTWATTPCATST